MNPALVAHSKPFGKHRLLWGKAGRRFPGTCLLGPDWPCLVFSFILIWGTTVGIMVGINPGGGQALVYLLGVASLILVTFFLCGAAFSDPGIIPKRERHINTRQQDMPPSTDPATGRTLCARCLVYRPKGAYHCRDCDACILELDRECAMCSTDCWKQTDARLDRPLSLDRPLHRPDEPEVLPSVSLVPLRPHPCSGGGCYVAEYKASLMHCVDRKLTVNLLDEQNNC